MAHSLSAKKRIRQNIKAKARNRARKDAIKTQTKAYLAVLGTGDLAKAQVELNKTVSTLDRVASKNTIHKNAAARKRSRLTLRLNALKASGGQPKVEAKTAKKGAGKKAAKA